MLDRPRASLMWQARVMIISCVSFTAANTIQQLYRVQCTVSAKGGVLEAAVSIAEDIADRRRKVGLRNDEGWLRQDLGPRASEHTGRQAEAQHWTGHL
jgi:hypothetical protein